MWKKIKAGWRAYKERRRISEEIGQKTFLKLSGELLELADTASKLWPQEPRFQARITRLKDEMRQLETLAAKPEFKRLSQKKRLELRQSLIYSKQQLLETMRSAPSPTTILQ